MHEASVSSAPEPRVATRASAAPSGETRAAEVRARLKELSQLFADNAVAATGDFTKQVSDESGLSGMPAKDKDRARRRAAEDGLDGFVLGLDVPSYRALLSGLDDRPLRKTIYEAFSTRASDRGPRAGRFDNTPVLTEMLELRYELARLSGYGNYAELALEDGIITDPDRAERCLLGRHRETRARAQAELDRLWAFAKARGVPRGFSLWDLEYYAAELEREELELSSEELTSYFAFDDIAPGALLLGAELSGLTLLRAPEEMEEPGGGRVYRASDRNGRRCGSLVLEPHGQDNGLSEAGLRLLEPHSDGTPRVLVECGFERCRENVPLLLDLEGLGTLFRSLGSALFLLATRELAEEDRGLSHASSLCADVAARFLAQFIGDFGTLSSFARHHVTGERLPHRLFEKLERKQAFLTNLRASQALDLTLFDLRVHRDHVPSHRATQLRVQVLDTFGQVRREQSVLPPPYWTRFANTATPIFVHGRAGRLWELDWAEEVGRALYSELEARAFSRDATSRLRETLWAPGARSAVERLSAARSGAKLPGC